jgi:hypothetical protein
MKPVKFKEANKNLLKHSNMTETWVYPDGKQCSEWWVYSDGQQCISCWKMTFKQRVSALFFGKIWLSVLSGSIQPPVWMKCEKSVFEKVK